MKLRDMTRKKKSTLNSMPEATSGCDEERYPYGLQISLEKEAINKLGIDIKKLKINDKVTVTAIADIESIRQNKTRRGENQNLRLQITKMDIKQRKTLKNT